MPRGSRHLLACAILAAAATNPHASPSPGDGPVTAGRAERVPDKPGAFHGAGAAPVARVRGGKRATGTLAGKTVYLSAGHGWMYSAGAWRTQRGNTHALVEDFITVESVNQYLVAYLQAMGAYVVPIREADLNPHAVVVDDPDATLDGEVAEVASTDAGWGAYPAPFDDATLLPFALGGARKLVAAAAESGRAVFTAAVPESGYYNVYFAYVQGPDRVPDAHVIVKHAGGEAHLRVDQRRHGSTWMLLGRWYFEAGGDAAVAIANDSTKPGATISFDAVRFGGGMAPHSRGGETTGRPAFESAAAYSTQLLGAPRTVYEYFGAGADSNNDVVSRPRFAAWEHEDGEDAVFLSWHTNAPSPGRGTMSIAYGNTYPCCRGLDDFAGTAGSIELIHAVHDRLIADLRGEFDPAWPNQGKVTASLGELNPSHNPEMPAILVELAYHDTAADAEALREPRFRRIAARAMARGIAKYFADQDGRALVLSPEPPTALRVENAGQGALRVSWRPAEGAARYRVYVGETGDGFDDGTEVEGETMLLDNLPRAALRFVRVAAVNDGGESLPTEVVGARVAAAGQAPVLVVGGFDRLDKLQMLHAEAPMLGIVDRMDLARMNDGTYAARHGAALAVAGYAFDGATDEAVAERDVDLARYQAIDWFAGEQANAGQLPAGTRDELGRFFAAGGKLLLSGAEVVWGLDSQGAPEDQQFAHDVLHVSLASDDAETYDVVALAGPYAGLPPISFHDTGAGGYDADFPDVLVAGAGATPVLAYGSADGGAAAVAWDHGIVIGFPFELVQGADARAKLMAATMAHFGVEPDPDQPGGGGIEPHPAGCGCTAGDPGTAALLGLALAALLRRRARRR